MGKKPAAIVAVLACPSRPGRRGFMSDLVVRHQPVPLAGMPRALSPLRIVQLSDLHFGRWRALHERICRRLERIECDLLVFTGDFCLFPRDWHRAVPLIRRLADACRPRLGAFAVLGNHDAHRLADAFSDGAVRFLRNESVCLFDRGHRFHVAGIDDAWRSVADVPSTLKGCVNGEPTILLAHVPSTIHHLPDGAVDLVLSGHTHGGQWRLPWWGSVTCNDRIRREQTLGLHWVDGRWLHVSSGIGTSSPFHFRFNCPSEVAVLVVEKPEVRQENS